MGSQRLSLRAKRDPIGRPSDRESGGERKFRQRSAGGRGRPVSWPHDDGSPRALQIAPNGHIYVASNGTSQVLDFAPDDSYVGSFGNVPNLTGLAVGPDNLIYAAGAGKNNRIYSPAGLEVGSFGNVDVALDVAPGGYLLGCADADHLMFVMDLGGNILRSWSVGSNNRGIAAGPDGYIYVVRDVEHDIQVYDYSGNLIRSFAKNLLSYPYGLAFSPRGTLYVADYGVGKVFELDYTTGAVISTITDHLSGPVDVTFRELTCTDNDGDGYFVESGCGTPEDCDDTNPAVHPGAPEVCNGIDDNCDGQIDEGLSRTLYRDADGDGYGDPAVTQYTCYSPPGWILQAGDCNDANAAVHPGAPEICNGIDDNCNGLVDEDGLGVDTDGDGIHNTCDNCRFVANPTQTDSDGDHVGNACDNCINTPNPNQADADGDGRGDACDNCPTIPNAFQDDADGDHFGDACDNCPLDFNSSQSDFDHDGEGDICDLNDGLIYVYSTTPDYIEWQQEAGPSNWNVYEGDLSVLRTTGVYTQMPGSNPLADRHCVVPDSYIGDFDVPSVGAVKFALVTGVTAGVEGSLGKNSAGAERANTNPCP